MTPHTNALTPNQTVTIGQQPPGAATTDHDTHKGTLSLIVQMQFAIASQPSDAIDLTSFPPSTPQHSGQGVQTQPQRPPLNSQPLYAARQTAHTSLSPSTHTQPWSDQAIGLHSFSDCTENSKHAIFCSWKTKDGKSWDLVWPVFAPSVVAILKGWLIGGSRLYRVCMFVCMLGSLPQNLCEEAPKEIMSRDYWLWGFEDSTFSSTLTTKSTEKRQKKKKLDGHFPAKPRDKRTTGKS